MTFQTSVNQQPAPAVAGDFCSANPRASVLAGAEALVAGANGLLVGRFAWVTFDSDGNPQYANNTGQGAPTGFLHREQQGLITTWLAESSLMVPAYLFITLHNEGDFWVQTNSTATYNQKVFANYLDGSAKTGAAGATLTDFTGTATFATNVMTVASVTSGTVLVGARVISAGVATETYVQSQLTGTPGGTGTYQLTTTPGTITPAQAITTTDYVETKWYAKSAAPSGKLIKMSTRS